MFALSYMKNAMPNATSAAMLHTIICLQLVTKYATTDVTTYPEHQNMKNTDPQNTRHLGPTYSLTV